MCWLTSKAHALRRFSSEYKIHGAGAQIAFESKILEYENNFCFCYCLVHRVQSLRILTVFLEKSHWLGTHMDKLISRAFVYLKLSYTASNHWSIAGLFSLFISKCKIWRPVVFIGWIGQYFGDWEVLDST